MRRDFGPERGRMQEPADARRRQFGEEVARVGPLRRRGRVAEEPPAALLLLSGTRIDAFSDTSTHFNATSRLVSSSVPLYTTAVPPRLMSSPTTYRPDAPKRVPARNSFAAAFAIE